ncbi:hypothetical protein ABNG03_18285 [Halorubrum sp. RMP-47]|uniref:hypothetical protein n=1 Tax=Halorubrum miltondacostae TaxID=3076378 RepID=UPI003526E813
MRGSTAFWSSAAGIGLGGVLAGTLWWLDASSVLVVGTGVVWAAALGLTLYVSESYDDSKRSGPWAAVIGGSLLISVLLDLSDITISNGSSAALTSIVIGFTLLGYAAGMATVHGQEHAEIKP